MSTRARSVAAISLCLACGFAAAQDQLASPSKSPELRLATTQKPAVPKAIGPTLEFTMEYIQDKLISRGALSYQVNLHDSAAGKDWSYEFTDKLSGTYANPSTCQIGFHWKQTRSGQVVTDKETYFDLRTGAKLDVLTMDQYLSESAARSGHDSWSTKVSPALFVLRIVKPDNHESNFVFPEEDTANHLAKALAHAAELCKSTEDATATPAVDKQPF